MPVDLDRFKLLIRGQVKDCLDSGNNKNDVLKAVMDATYDALFHMPPEEAEQLLDKFRDNPNQFREYLQENFTGR